MPLTAPWRTLLVGEALKDENAAMSAALFFKEEALKDEIEVMNATLVIGRPWRTTTTP